ncbi:MAG: hypothetical protein A2Y07_04595 [Planctomycetes bacterium GWF2_50_10]|nr:MAG: hypothetical protein A2Y07_04595 [Planctomycetes bacterium GWF2_50_10]
MDKKDYSKEFSQTGQDSSEPSGPAAAFKVIIIFLIPMGVFIGAAILCDKFLPAIPGARRDLKPLVGFVISGIVTAAALYLLKRINRHLVKNKV